jgi:phosphomannomutase
MYNFHPTILREYDIRGIVGETLSVDDAYAIGRSFASFKPEWKNEKPRIAVCRDGRLSSPALEEALTRGLNESGAEVIRLGIGPTPMLYFAVCSLELSGGIMITGSHNPPSHNGFKFMLGRKSFYGADIQKLGKIAAASGGWFEGKGGKTEIKIEAKYLAVLEKGYAAKRPLKIVWDAGNGAAGEIVAALCKKLPGEHTTLYTEIDGTFPNHHPDPSVAKNLADLIRTVKEKKCDLGLAFDGDGDRVGVVDEEGEILWGDQILALMARDVLATHKGATVIADVKASQMLFDEVARLGGKPLMWKTGHSLIKTKMAETGALLAGEMSGHMFFADKYYGYDDGIYAAVRMASFLAESVEKLSTLRKSLPKSHATPELRIACADERKFAVIDEVKASLKKQGADVNDVDGVRVKTKEGWWLLRASNTQAALVGRCEASTPEGVKLLEANLRATLAASGVAFTEASH